MKSNSLTDSKYFLETFKDFYSIKNKILVTPLNLNEDQLYLYDIKLFDVEMIRREVYKNFINNNLVKPKRLKIKYIDLNINNESDLFIYNFVKEYSKVYKNFRSYKKANKDYKDITLNHSIKYKRKVKSSYNNYKKLYLEYRNAFKLLFKNNPKLGKYYLYLSNCDISEDNINIIEPIYLI